MRIQKFWVEISEQANEALVEDAKAEKRSRKKQAEFVLENYYKQSEENSGTALRSAQPEHAQARA